MGFRIFMAATLFFGGFALGIFAALGRKDVFGNIVDSVPAFLMHVLGAVALVAVAGAVLVWNRA